MIMLLFFLLGMVAIIGILELVCQELAIGLVIIFIFVIIVSSLFSSILTFIKKDH